jgi:two-component system, OmpR family, response regulator MtrA
MSNVLVIFDDIIVRQKLRNALRSSGFRVASTGDGEAALRFARQVPFDVVVADVMATGKDGIEVIKDIQRVLPDSKFIAVSGSSLTRSRDFQALVVRLGVEKFFTMPFSGTDLARAAVDMLRPNRNDATDAPQPMVGIA